LQGVTFFQRFSHSLLLLPVVANNPKTLLHGDTSGQYTNLQKAAKIAKIPDFAWYVFGKLGGGSRTHTEQSAGRF
jgi:hypothetical protein